MDNTAKTNIQHLLYETALSARGQVLVGEATKEEVLRYIAEIGNEQFEKVFAMDDDTVLESMLEIILEGRPKK